jgi:hypothetical protein
MSCYSQLYNHKSRGHFYSFIEETGCAWLIQLKNDSNPKKAKDAECNLPLKEEALLGVSFDRE